MRGSDLAEKGLPPEQSSDARSSRLNGAEDQRTSTAAPTEIPGDISDSQTGIDPPEQDNTSGATDRKTSEKE